MRHATRLATFAAAAAAALGLGTSEPVRAQQTIPCEETSDCPPRTCFHASCVGNRYCRWMPLERAAAQCPSGRAVCVADASGAATWPCKVDCASGQAVCTSASAFHVCLPEHAWAPEQHCPEGTACAGGACKPVPPPCQNGARRCTFDAKSYSACVAGEWSAPVRCPQDACRGGACCDCAADGATRCSASAVETCTGGSPTSCPSWVPTTACGPDEVCVNDSSCACRPGAVACRAGKTFRCDGYVWAEVGTCNAEFAWSYAGTLPGWHCTQIVESADPHRWFNNFLCSRMDRRFAWSSAGQISGMRCTQIYEHAEPPSHTWLDNFLCVPSDSGVELAWSEAGPIAGYTCLNVDEPFDPDAWADNYLCARVSCDPRCPAGSTCRGATCVSNRPCRKCPGGCCGDLVDGCCVGSCKRANGSCP